MTPDQRNRLVAQSARFFYWSLVAGIVANMSVDVFLVDGWTDWNLLYFASEILLLVCVYPKLVRLEQPFIRWLMRRYGHDA